MRWFALPPWILSATLFLADSGPLVTAATTEDNADVGATRITGDTALKQPLSALEFSSAMRPPADSQAPLPELPGSDGLAQSGAAILRASAAVPAKSASPRSSGTRIRALQLYRARFF